VLPAVLGIGQLNGNFNKGGIFHAKTSNRKDFCDGITSIG
jgi:hypothetical protein